MDRRQYILLPIFLILVFNCEGKSSSTRSLISTTSPENSKESGNKPQDSGFNMPQLFRFLSDLTTICSNNSNETSNINDKVNETTDESSYISYLNDRQTDDTVLPILCRLQKYLNAVSQIIK
ncbi:uncharacterized protein LOC114942017 [Nylanderia fulva]|uniref:uncharacterized protein LOC114942017 n=1 Tax=Nylanderia fulva TaxID=613905 RepID=UPI0010FB2307|nr:uncharacterized protein LOC114942017 [Nylanderia fulva]